MILTTKVLAKQYGLKEAQIRKVLRKSTIPKIQEGYFWWIEEKYKGDIEQLIKKEIQN